MWHYNHNVGYGNEHSEYHNSSHMVELSIFSLLLFIVLIHTATSIQLLELYWHFEGSSIYPLKLTADSKQLRAPAVQ